MRYCNVKPQYWMMAMQPTMPYDENGEPFHEYGTTSYVKFDRRWSYDHVIDEAIQIGMQRKYVGIIVYVGDILNERVVFHTKF